MSMPCKTHDVQNFAMDSRRWNGFPFRDGDIVIATWAKSGTTWLQHIVGQLLLGPKARLRIDLLSPWVEHRIEPMPLLRARLEAQRQRRFLKTHLPLDALVFSPGAKYLFIGRDGRDVVRSLYGFHRNHTPLAYRIINEAPGLVGPALGPPPLDYARYFLEWLERDGHPWWPFWSHLRSWWAFRALPNIRLIHFNDLKADLPAMIASIAEYLEIDVSADTCAEIASLCSFERMKASSGTCHGAMADKLYQGGMSSLFRKGEIGDGRELLGAELNACYERRAEMELPDACRVWLATGQRDLCNLQRVSADTGSTNIVTN